MWLNSFVTTPSAEPGPSSAPEAAEVRKARAALRVGLPRALNIWSTHQFWLGFLGELGIEKVDFSSETSEEQMREYGKGRGTVDCCYPVKCVSGHYGELLARTGARKIDLLLSPMISSVPSFLGDSVLAHLTCPRVMAGPENIKAGFIKEQDAFAAQGVRYLAPFVSLADRPLATRQLYAGLKDAIPGLGFEETRRAVEVGYRQLDEFTRAMRQRSRRILETCARENRPALLVLARPYHMDPGLGHEIEADLQARGYPVLWAQYLPIDDDLLGWLFGADLRAGRMRTPFDIDDVWPSSYSANTNELMWAAKFAARMPWIACVLRLSSYECGMDQPTYTPLQRIVEQSGTLYFAFQDLDATRPAGSLKIRVETIDHYLGARADAIMTAKLAAAAADCPLLASGEPPAADGGGRAEAFNAQAKQSAAQGDLGDALRGFDAAIRLAPGDAMLICNRGLARAGLGDLAGAEDDFTTALLMRPDDVPAHVNRGIVRARQGRLDQAIADYDAGAELDPGAADIYYNRALAWVRKGIPSLAQRDFDRAIQLRPDYQTAIAARERARLASGCRADNPPLDPELKKDEAVLSKPDNNSSERTQVNP